MKSFPQKIKYLREKNNLSIKELSHNLNITPQTLKKWETKHTNISSKKLVMLSKIFKVKVDYLLGLIDEEK